MEIPAGLLKPGKRYGMSVEFIRINELKEDIAFLGGTITQGIAQVSSTEFYIQVAGTSAAYNWSLDSNATVAAPATPGSIVELTPGTTPVYYNLELRITGLPSATYTANFTTGGNTQPQSYGWMEDYSSAYVFGLGMGTSPTAPSYMTSVLSGGQVVTSLTAVPPVIPPANTHRLPSVLLSVDIEGFVTQMDWSYVDPTTGTTIDFPAGASGQGIEFRGTQGQFLYSEYGLDSTANSLYVEGSGITYDEIGSINHYYVDEAGNRHSSRLILNREAPADPAANYFLNTTRANATWLSTPTFGWFSDEGFPWIYHLGHGFLYCAGAGQGSYYLYDSRLGWLYTSESLYQANYLYSYRAGGWIMYLKSTSAPGRWFYYNGAWISEENLSKL